jgi:hypothetical protein
MTQTERNRLILEGIKKLTDAAMESPKTARKALISGGIYTKKGKLRAEYGGEPKKSRSAA